MNQQNNIPDYLDNKNFDQTELSNLLTGAPATENLDENGNQLVVMIT